MGFFTGISNKFISGYADAFFVYCSVPVCFLYSSTIICAFGLASAAPRSPYRHLELCGIALEKFLQCFQLQD